VIAGFNWILSNRLAGSAQPGLLAELDEDLGSLREVGIARIVTLTERPLSAAAADAGFELIHFPVPDMGIPTPRSCERLCRALVAGLDARPVLLHCRGGLGRTGTVAACCLINLGQEPEQALTAVRRVNPNYVQSAVQEQFLRHYAKWLAREDD
jgi:atypical dual specificity phosphatase